MGNRWGEGVGGRRGRGWGRGGREGGKGGVGRWGGMVISEMDIMGKKKNIWQGMWGTRGDWFITQIRS